jgi:hypothetical protein
VPCSVENQRRGRICSPTGRGRHVVPFVSAPYVMRRRRRPKSSRTFSHHPCLQPYRVCMNRRMLRTRSVRPRASATADCQPKGGTRMEYACHSNTLQSTCRLGPEFMRAHPVQGRGVWFRDPLDQAAGEGAAEPLSGPPLHPRHRVDEEIAQHLPNGDPRAAARSGSVCNEFSGQNIPSSAPRRSRSKARSGSPSIESMHACQYVIRLRQFGTRSTAPSRSSGISANRPSEYRVNTRSWRSSNSFTIGLRWAG